jgi:cytochrome b6-f complex iron-sulfur subunit
MQPEVTDQETLSRGEFMRSLGLSTGALMAFYCLGTATTSCKSDDPAPATPTPSGNGITGTTTGNAINFTVDLANSNYSKLKTKGEFVKEGDVFIVNTNSGIVALSRLCTHQSLDTLSYRSANDDIRCTTHGSVFKTDGTVTTGPAARPLTRYTATVSGNTLTVKA